MRRYAQVCAGMRIPFRTFQGGLLESWAFEGWHYVGPRGHVGFSSDAIS